MNRQEVTGSDKVLSLHCQLLELLLHEWEECSDVGSDHTPELQQQLFAGVSAEDPHLLAELCIAHSNQAQAAGGGAATPTEQTRMRIQGYADVLQVRKKIRKRKFLPKLATLNLWCSSEIVKVATSVISGASLLQTPLGPD